jgi:sugar/nucleoside kinase (ribokinase family)
VIVSRDFALKFTGMLEVNTAAQSLWTPSRQAIVVTCGKDGCWYLTRRDPKRAVHLPAMKVETVDTTGCGDVFHGAYAAALVQGRDIPEAVRYATIAAGIKATRRGGTAGIPDNFTVERQLDRS